MKTIAFGVTIGWLVSLITSQAIPPGICQGRPFGYFVRDVTDCSAYFLCTNAAPHRDFCLPSGTHFDEASQRCVWPADANCFRCPPFNPFVDVEVGNQCQHFVRCIDDRPTQMQCASGLVFDPESGTCNQAARVVCSTSLPIQCPARDNPENRIFVRNPNDCSQFFTCVNGDIVRRRCAPGLQFNLVTRTCDQSFNPNCPVIR